MFHTLLLYAKRNTRKKQKPRKHKIFEVFKEATTRFELVIRVLQTHALPLGYVAIYILYSSKNFLIRQYQNDSYGNRTRVTAVKGRCLNRLTMEPNILPYNICNTHEINTVVLGFVPSKPNTGTHPPMQETPSCLLVKPSTD